MNISERVSLICAVAILGTASIVSAGGWNSAEDSGDCRHSNADFCEVREIDLKARQLLDVDGAANGGIHVKGWGRSEISISARVTVRADGDENRAERIAREIEIDTNGQIKASGPRSERNKSWSVEYRIKVPHQTDLELHAINGGISIADVRGEIDAETTNGGLNLSSLAGDVRGRTTNGGLDIQLEGQHWSGKGLNARSTNGGVKLAVPENYSADLSLSTVNGGMHLDFPVTVSGQIDKKIHAKIGKGGAPIKVSTTNGGVRLHRD